jgi:UDP-glucose 4-epimerase
MPASSRRTVPKNHRRQVLQPTKYAAVISKLDLRRAQSRTDLRINSARLNDSVQTVCGKWLPRCRPRRLVSTRSSDCEIDHVTVCGSQLCRNGTFAVANGLDGLLVHANTTILSPLRRRHLYSSVPAGRFVFETAGFYPYNGVRADMAVADAGGCRLAESAIDLVTGGAGFIGSHLVDRLIAQGRSVRVFDSFVVGRRANLKQHEEGSRLQIIEGDVADQAAVAAAVAGVERIFHLAARADIVPSIQEPAAYFRSNVDGTFCVLEAARQHGVKRLVYVASSSCYGIPATYPTPETAAADPRYPYALTKYLGEQLVMHWSQVYRLPAVSVRFFNVYGPRARTSGTYGAVFGVFLAQLLAGEPLTIVGDGEQTRDFTFVSDVVDALIAVAESDRIAEIYNVGSGHPVSVNELVRLLGSPPSVYIPKRPGEPDCTWADISKIRRELGWEPKVSFADGVRLMRDNIDYWRDAPVWSASRIAEATSDWFRFLGDVGAGRWTQASNN